MFSKCVLLLLLAEAALGIRVFLHPSQSLPSTSSLSPTQARAVVSHHLGLEAFDPIQDVKGAEQLVWGEFVGKGTENALLLTLSEDVASDVIPPTLKQSFSLSNPPSASSEMSFTVSSYLQRAQHVYSTIFSEAPLDVAPRLLLDIFTAHPSYATDVFLSETSQLVAFVESEETDSFGAFALKGLAELRDTYGQDSELYKLAAETTRATINSALSKQSLALAILTYPTVPTNTHAVRQQPPQSPLPPYATPSPQLPIGGVSTCHTSSEACGNATSSCSGHGSCVEAHKAGRTCFVCACAPTRDDADRIQEWAGDACERKDISAPFVLITGTVIGILLVIFGSVSLLYTVGAQELPSTLVAGASGHVKHD